MDYAKDCDDILTSARYIASLSFDGAIHIANGPTIRINDPNAKYSAGYKDIPFFAADDENPSISSFGKHTAHRYASKIAESVRRVSHVRAAQCERSEMPSV